jgi:hypothetical protein
VAAASCISTGYGGELELARSRMTGTRGDPGSQVWVDGEQGEVRLIAGPFQVPHMTMHGDAAMAHQAGMTTPLVPLVWPVRGGLRGFKLRIFTGDGTPLPRRLIHHLNLLDFNRRELLYPVPTRLIAIGADTPDMRVPTSHQVRLERGDSLGWYIMWNNESGPDIEDVYVELALAYGDTDGARSPLTTIYMDTNLKVGSPTSFDVPPGRSEKSYVWESPVGGALLGAGGHMHQYGVEVRLEDVQTGEVMFRLASHSDEEGEAWVDQKIFRRFFNLFDASIQLKANHPYRIVGVYDNPTGGAIPAGGMAQIGGLFRPQDWARWPANDSNDPLYRLDVSGLPSSLAP